MGYQVIGDSTQLVKHLARNHVDSYLLIFPGGKCLRADSLDDELIEMTLEGEMEIIKFDGAMCYRLSRDGQKWVAIDDVESVELVLED